MRMDISANALRRDLRISSYFPFFYGAAAAVGFFHPVPGLLCYAAIPAVSSAIRLVKRHDGGVGPAGDGSGNRSRMRLAPVAKILGRGENETTASYLKVQLRRHPTLNEPNRPADDFPKPMSRSWHCPARSAPEGSCVPGWPDVGRVPYGRQRHRCRHSPRP